MLRFEQDVRLNCNASPADIAERLNRLVAPRYTFTRKNERRKLLRGTVTAEGGVLRWPLNEYRLQSARNLHFRLEEATVGSTVIGSFQLWKPLRLIVLAWLALGLAVWGWTCLRVIFTHAGLSAVGKDVGFMLLGTCMATGDLGFGVYLGKTRDATLVRLLRVSLASEMGADVATYLLTPPARTPSEFLDPVVTNG
jgi:hypothetical protein